ncbi:hypothetical protein [Streptomyces cyaneofuscatus]|uniref:hypothetical protein n=1 Tax=Streptomyces cyaneofuscatus TaxID=66883 RepID=UPI0036579763
MESMGTIPDDTATHRHLYGGREDTEAGFSQFDRPLFNRRMITFGTEAQSPVISHRVFSHVVRKAPPSLAFVGLARTPSPQVKPLW